MSSFFFFEVLEIFNYFSMDFTAWLNNPDVESTGPLKPNKNPRGHGSLRRPPRCQRMSVTVNPCLPFFGGSHPWCMQVPRPGIGSTSQQQCQVLKPLCHSGNSWMSVIIYFFFLFLGAGLQHMEDSGPGVELELQLPGYTTATAKRGSSCICNPHHCSWQPDP